MGKIDTIGNLIIFGSIGYVVVKNIDNIKALGRGFKSTIDFFVPDSKPKELPKATEKPVNGGYYIDTTKDVDIYKQTRTPVAGINLNAPSPFKEKSLPKARSSSKRSRKSSRRPKAGINLNAPSPFKTKSKPKKIILKKNVTTYKPKIKKEIKKNPILKFLN